MSRWRLFALSLLWFAWNAQWRTVPVVLVPDQLLLLLGNGAPHIELASGGVLAAGALVSLIVTPIAGAMSDRSRHRSRRRLDFIAWGVAGTSAASALLVWTGQIGFVWYLCAYLCLQFFWNWAAGPFAGLIPDLVPASQRGAASSWINGLGIAGGIAGNLMVLGCYRPGHPGETLWWFGVLNVGCLAGTVAGVRKPLLRASQQSVATYSVSDALAIPWAGNQNFYWSMAARLLTNLGVWSLLSYLNFYLRFVAGLSQQQTAATLPLILFAGTVAGIPGSLVTVPLIRRLGEQAVVRWSAWVMAASAALLGMTAFSPTLPAILATIALFGIAHGLFGAADWALALRVLPPARGAGVSLGVWHVCMVLPQMFGPITTGLLIATTKETLSVPWAYGLAFAAAVVWFIAGAILVCRVQPPQNTSPHCSRSRTLS